MAKSFLEQFIEDLEAEVPARKPKKVRKNKVSVKFVDQAGTNPVNFGGGVLDASQPANMAEFAQEHKEAVQDASPLVKSVLNLLNGGREDSIERLAFETNPSVNNTYQSLWKRKLKLLPDELLKRIAIQDDLVAAIVNARSQMVSAFGRPQPDRFSTGFKIEAEPGIVEKLDSQGKEDLQKQIQRAESILLTCGQTKGWKDYEDLSFGQFLFQQARNAVIFGRCATEMIYVDQSGERKWHSFRPIDAGTIYRAAPVKEAAESVRRHALSIIAQIKNKTGKLKPERFVNDEYAWVQVVEGRPIQAFTPEECIVHNFYPVTDIELDGYPLTPLDTVISAVTTHINITTHNKLYFQSGRAARGMLVFKSDEVDDRDIDPIRQQFNANINGVGNAWRMPVIGVGTEDEVTWTPIEGQSGRDMEFQYLSDTNARVILSAFQMSPEELPGYAHLSRGTNNQALSESNNEYKLEAHRDVGIRPLIAQLQNHVNQKILPLIDPDLATKASIKFVGLDVDTAEKESVRLQQDMAVHMTMDEVLDKVEKKPVGKKWGGRFLLNPQWQQALFQHRYVGEIMEEFFDVKGASQDPTLRYIRDPMWFSWQELLQQQQQMQQQQQAEQQQAQQQQQMEQQQQETDLTRSADQILQALGGDQQSQQSGLGKSEKGLPTSKKKLLYHQRAIVNNILSAFEKEARNAIGDITKDVNKLTR